MNEGLALLFFMGGIGFGSLFTLIAIKWDDATTELNK